METFRIGILSDIHYASTAEQARGNDYEYHSIKNPIRRAAISAFMHFAWMQNPLGQNHLLDKFLSESGALDFVVANGDYSCNSMFVGVGDDAARESARQCLTKLREKFPNRFQATFGDHELGKLSTFTGQGGMRLESWRRAIGDLQLEPFWRVELGKYVLMGIVSSLVALPVFEPDMLPEERADWEKLRGAHLQEIRHAFAGLKSDQRVLLFCHDPTALPFLGRDEIVRSKICQIEQTIIGHLHSNLVLWKSRLLAGLPTIHFLGNAGRRMSTALGQAKEWKPFHVRLCPALAGIELLKDGGYLTAELAADASRPARFEFHRIKR